MSFGPEGQESRRTPERRAAAESQGPEGQKSRRTPERRTAADKGGRDKEMQQKKRRENRDRGVAPRREPPRATDGLRGARRAAVPHTGKEEEISQSRNNGSSRGYKRNSRRCSVH